MARDFEINIAGLERLMRMSPEAAGRGAKRGLHDALDDWKSEATDIAPISPGGGTLRRGIKAEGVKGSGLDMKAEISSTAIEESNGGRFNYAYYIHELNAGGANVSSGEKKYLDKSAEVNKAKWMRWVEEEIQKELRREGW
jgi:hypothetical protein